METIVRITTYSTVVKRSQMNDFDTDDQFI